MERTSLFDYHKRKAKLTEFAGFEMPLWYSSISEEHLTVRNDVGIFDVSHMGRISLRGPDASEFLEHLLPTSVSGQPNGKSFYTLLLNERGGIIDDLIVLKHTDDDYLLVVNAANKDKDLGHIKKHAGGLDFKLEDLTAESTMIAIQGPHAEERLQNVTPLDLNQVKRFRCSSGMVMGHKATISRTGYTGEDGFEIILHQSGVGSPEGGLEVWERLARSCKPCGLGARDSLRIEAGLPLYGSDISEDDDPVEANLAWVISKAKSDYLGAPALREQMAEAPQRIRRGLVLDEQIPRSGFGIEAQGGDPVGRFTSGTFSPIIRKGIGIGYLDAAHSEFGSTLRVKVRDSTVRATVTRTPFYDESVYGWKRAKQ